MLIYWLIIFFIYIIDKNKLEIKPNKFNLNFKKPEILYLYLKIFLNPYLYSYSTIYFILNKQKKPLLNIFLSLVFRFITGLSINLLKKSIEDSKLILNIISYNATSLLAYVDTIFFNLNKPEMKSIFLLEILRIYKNEKTKWNFNPKNENDINKILKKYFSKVFFENKNNLSKKEGKYFYDFTKNLIENLGKSKTTISGKIYLKDYPKQTGHEGTVFQIGKNTNLIKNYSGQSETKTYESTYESTYNRDYKNPQEVVDKQNQLKLTKMQNLGLSDSSNVTPDIFADKNKIVLDKISFNSEGARKIYNDIYVLESLHIFGLSSKADKVYTLENGKIIVTDVRDKNIFIDIIKTTVNKNNDKLTSFYMDNEKDITEFANFIKDNNIDRVQFLQNYVFNALSDKNILEILDKNINNLDIKNIFDQ